MLAAGRHAVRIVRDASGGQAPAGSRVRLVTGTGHPEAVVRTAREAGLEVCALSKYRDHHWFSPAEARREVECARRQQARVLLTPKDEVRWPGNADDGRLVMDVEWQWVAGGERLERAVAGEEP